MRLLTDDEITRQLEGLEHWSRVPGEGEPAITTSYELTDFADALALVNRIGGAAETINHHPDIDIRWNVVTLVLSTHSEGGLTQADIEAAHRFDDEAGLS